MITNNNFEHHVSGKTISFTFIYDPLWDENILLKEFKTKIKSNIKYYKYKMYLNKLSKAKTWKAFLKTKHNLPDGIGLENNVVFWWLGDEIFSSYIKKKNINDAIIFRAMWYVEINNITGIEFVKNFTCYDYECDRTILEEKEKFNKDT